MTTRHARGGKEILSDGGFWWSSDFGDFQRQYNLTWQTVNNGASLITQRCPVTTEFYHYGFDIPAGRELVIFSYSLRLGAGEGAYEIDTIRAPDGFTGGTTALKHALKSSSASVVQTNVQCGATPNAGTPTVVERDFLDTGTAIGAARNADSATTEGTLRVWRASDHVMLRIKRLSAVNYTTRIRLYCWERDIP